MRYLKFVIIILLFKLFISSCIRQSCNGFPEYLESWIPYKSNQIIIFKNQLNDSINLNISSINVTSPYKESERCKCVCSASKSFKTSFNIKLNSYLKIEFLTTNNNDTNCVITGTLSSGILRCGLNEYKREYTVDLFNTVTNEYKDSILSIVDNISIDGKVYSNVIYIFTDTISNKTTNIWKIGFAKGIGVVQIYDCSGVIWSLQ